MEALCHVPIEGELTIGAPDDYLVTFFPDVLGGFTKMYPHIRLHVVSEPSRRLMEAVSAKRIDLALVTEGEGATGGTVVHREPLVWVTSQRHPVHRRDPTPLAVFHSGDVFRRHATDQLERAGRRIYVALTSSSFSGISAAVQSGVAVAAIFRSSVCPGMRILNGDDGFPELADVGLVLQRSDQGPRGLADCFQSHLTRSLGPVYS
jgi:DNA-binding transcriptional LysR family regulator